MGAGHDASPATGPWARWGPGKPRPNYTSQRAPRETTASRETSPL